MTTLNNQTKTIEAGYTTVSCVLHQHRDVVKSYSNCMSSVLQQIRDVVKSLLNEYVPVYCTLKAISTKVYSFAERGGGWVGGGSQRSNRQDDDLNYFEAGWMVCVCVGVVAVVVRD